MERHVDNLSSCSSDKGRLRYPMLQHSLHHPEIRMQLCNGLHLYLQHKLMYTSHTLCLFSGIAMDFTALPWEISCRKGLYKKPLLKRQENKNLEFA